MSPRQSNYGAVLFRGWEWVRLDYALTRDSIVVSRKSTWSGVPVETAVSLIDLSGQVRHVIARQPAHWIALGLLVAVGLTLAGDLLFFQGGMRSAGGRGIYWPLWGPALTIGVLAWCVMWRTRRPLAWTFFQPKSSRRGLYVLHDPRSHEAHAHFIATISRKIQN
jgi:hypothetical protein